MTSDYLTLGPVPFEEECQGVGMPTYDLSAALAECKRYRRLLEELFPPPEEVYGFFKTKAFPHDFGTYHEVCAIFDADDEESCAWAFDVENSLPATWDDRPVLKSRRQELTETEMADARPRKRSPTSRRRIARMALNSGRLRTAPRNG